MHAILFVCQGNICRSPAGEAVLLHLAKINNIPLHAASCGVAVDREGVPPDFDMAQAASRRGIHFKSVAQAFRLRFFDIYTMILASDHSTYQILQRYAPDDQSAQKIHLMTEYSEKYRGLEIPVPDPHIGDVKSYDAVLDIITDACEGILKQITKKLSAT